MHQGVQHLLAALEVAHGIRILHACEGGSRAWGFASADSDFDVRFVHVKPREWYVRVQEAPTTGKASVVEHMSEDRVLDAVGWDLRKALLLLAKSNPSLLEHMHSPIVYRDTPEGEELVALARRYFSPKRCLHHYLSMAWGTRAQHLGGERVRLKKYLYVLRPVLASRWIANGRGIAPVEFQRLVEHELPSDQRELRDAVAKLVSDKMAGDELGEAPAIPVLDAFLASELERLLALCDTLREPQPDMAPLDDYFRRVAGFQASPGRGMP